MRARIRASRIGAPRVLRYANFAPRGSRRNPGSSLLTYTSCVVLCNGAIAIALYRSSAGSPNDGSMRVSHSQTARAGQPFWPLLCAMAARRRAASLRAFALATAEDRVFCAPSRQAACMLSLDCPLQRANVTP